MMALFPLEFGPYIKLIFERGTTWDCSPKGLKFFNAIFNNIVK